MPNPAQTMNRTGRVLSIATLALIAGSALGQAQQPNEGRAERRERQAESRAERQNQPAEPGSTVLRGPELVDARPGDAQRPAGPEGAERRAMPHFQAILGAVRSLNRAEDESLHLTPAQTDSMKQIFAAHREAARAFAEEHRDEIAKLREAARPTAGRNGRPARDAGEDGMMMEDAPEMDEGPRERPRRERQGDRRPAGQPEDGAERAPANPPANPEARAARERLQEFLAAAPFNGEAIKELTAILTPEQQAHVRKTLQAQRERAEKAAREGQAEDAAARPGPARRRVGATRQERVEGDAQEAPAPATNPAQRERRRPGQDD